MQDIAVYIATVCFSFFFFFQMLLNRWQHLMCLHNELGFWANYKGIRNQLDAIYNTVHLNQASPLVVFIIVEKSKLLNFLVCH